MEDRKIPTLRNCQKGGTVLLLSLSSLGTLGHTLLLLRLQACLENSGVHALTATDSEWGKAGVVQPDFPLKPAVKRGSLGGALRTSYWQSLQKIIDDITPMAVVFSTFFCVESLQRIREAGAITVLCTYPYRDTWEEIFLCEGYEDLFDLILLLREPFEFFQRTAMREVIGMSNLPNVRRMLPPIVQFYPTKQAKCLEERKSTIRILGLFGGGGTPDSCRTSTLIREALLSLATIPSVETLFLPGPYSESSSDFSITSQDRSPIISGPHVYSHGQQLISDSDLVISEAGFSTVWELVRQETPAVLVPSYRNTDNQDLRAYRMHQAGVAYALIGKSQEDLVENVSSLACDPDQLSRMQAACRNVNASSANTIVGDPSSIVEALDWALRNRQERGDG